MLLYSSQSWGWRSISTVLAAHMDTTETMSVSVDCPVSICFAAKSSASVSHTASLRVDPPSTS
eukprot:755933-Prymnesium_polylepis.1